MSPFILSFNLSIIFASFPPEADRRINNAHRLINMGLECNYSFADLFKAAHERTPTSDELSHFHEMSQIERNILVTAWAENAGWYTKDKKGTDGCIYTAFAPFSLENETRNKIPRN